MIKWAKGMDLKTYFSNERYFSVDRDHFLSTNENGDYILTHHPIIKFNGRMIPPKRCHEEWSLYYKIDRGDRFDLVGIGIMLEIEGDFWVSQQLVGCDSYEYVDENKVAATPVLVYEMPKGLLSRWNYMSLDERNQAKEPIIKAALHKLFAPRKLKTEDAVMDDNDITDDEIAEIPTDALETVFDNMLADMFDAEAQGEDEFDEDEYEDEDECEGNTSEDIEVLGKALSIS